MKNYEPIYTSHQSLSNDLKGVMTEVRDKKILERYYADNPYVVLGLAAVAGYIAAGGLFSPFSRRLLRIGMKAVFIPAAISKVSDAATK